jgi:hypothetical protein
MPAAVAAASVVLLVVALEQVVSEIRAEQVVVAMDMSVEMVQLMPVVVVAGVAESQQAEMAGLV